ncbi:MAG: FAD-dependent monooxygenase, partial [Bacteroidota bacterium]|nr:FAD-dependent monooxygenase [Bacteroidota bacterium]
MKTKEDILIIGAGLCGSLLALRMGQRGHRVRVMERRSDLRKVDLKAGRSINLALSNRGLKALKMVGLEAAVKPLCIPMYGRMIHDKKGRLKMSKYSGRKGEYINSISRELLTALLIDQAEALENVSFEFNLKCNEVDFKNNIASFT